MPLRSGLPLALLTGVAFAETAFAAPEVVASIRPVHSLVAGVMEGVGEPTLLVDGVSSPHGYVLSPSNARAIESADLVFWIGPALETFLQNATETLGQNATSVELMEAEGVEVRPFREPDAVFRLAAAKTGEAGEGEDDHEGEGHEHAHAHGEEGHTEAQGEDAHAHSDGEASHTPADDEETHAHEDDGSHHHGHDHSHAGTMDGHIWLDPQNAAAMVGAIEAALSEADPENAKTYATNAEAMREALSEFDEATRERLSSLSNEPFVVFHDAYAYFENRYGLQSVGTVVVNPEVEPGVQRVRALQSAIQEAGVRCIFAEPQFPQRMIDVVSEGSDVEVGVLDPLGAEHEAGPALYGQLIEEMTASFADCLSGRS